MRVYEYFSCDILETDKKIPESRVAEYPEYPY